MRKFTIRDVESAVCQSFNITPERLHQRSHARRIARPRQIAMYIARAETGASFPMIGNYFDRDHTTVMTAQRRISQLVTEDLLIRARVYETRRILDSLVPWRQRIAAAIAARAEG